MEQLIMEFGLKDGLFAGLFVWLLLRQMKASDKREEKLYGFLDSMKVEFAKLVGSYETLSTDVTHIRNELENKVDKHDKAFTRVTEIEVKGEDE